MYGEDVASPPERNANPEIRGGIDARHRRTDAVCTWHGATGAWSGAR